MLGCQGEVLTLAGTCVPVWGWGVVHRPSRSGFFWGPPGWAGGLEGDRSPAGGPQMLLNRICSCLKGSIICACIIFMLH